jgi:hypothetical protein
MPAEWLMTEPSAFEVEIDIVKLKKKSTGIYQIPTEMIRVWRKTFHPDFCKYVNSIWNKQELPEELRESIFVPIN